MKTFSQKTAQVNRRWYILDASQTTLGRIATVAACLLIGKSKPTFTPHVDGGDYVVIINANALKITGNKQEAKLYQNHSGYPGGMRTRQYKDVPNIDVLQQAIRGMLPVNKLRDGRLARLKIYASAEHGHVAQKPEVYDLKKGNK